MHGCGCVPCRAAQTIDLTAKNILCDEYQEAAEHVKQIDKEGKVWSFSADVYQMIAPCRFYIGLLDHINITKGEELKNTSQIT